MLTYIYDWIENIAFYLVIVVAALHMVPGESYKKYIRFFVGMILILMLVGPILKLWGMSEFPKEEYERRLQEIEEQMDTHPFIGNSNGGNSNSNESE